jgi:tetratricopeptide (TPR) repeat protein
MSNLAVAFRGLGRYDDARRVAQHAVDVGAATVPTRRLLYQLSVMAGDPAAAQQLAWGRGQPREFDLVAAQGQIAMFEGRWREGESLYRRAAEMAQARGLRGNAAGQFAHLAWLEAIYRPGPDLGERVRRMVALGAHQEEGASGRVRVTAALGLAGRRAEALAIVAAAEDRASASTYVRTVLVPVTRASLALYEGKPGDAVQALELARDVDIGGFGGLLPLYLRAEAYRQQANWTSAAAEYDRLIRHRGTDPYAPMVPMSWLGLGRAQAAMGNVAASRTSYEQALSFWRNADSDFPPRLAAQAEYDRLAQGGTAP